MSGDASQTIDIRERFLELLAIGREIVEKLISWGDPDVIPHVWLMSEVLFEVARIFNETYPSQPAITPDDELLWLVELRSEFMRSFSLWDLEGGE